MGLRRWTKLTFTIERDLEDLIIWKLTELRIFSYAFKFLKNEPNSLNVEIWLLDSKCSNKFKDKLAIEPSFFLKLIASRLILLSKFKLKFKLVFEFLLVLFIR